MNKTCTNNTPRGFVGHWREWHRGHGCDKDDGKPRSAEARHEIAQMKANETSGYLTDAELRHLRASTTSGNELLIRALDELAARRVGDRTLAVPAYDHSGLTAKHFEPLLGYCVCKDCEKLPSVAPRAEDHAP